MCPSSCTHSFASRDVEQPPGRGGTRCPTSSRAVETTAAVPAELRLAVHEGQDRDEQVHVGDRRAPCAACAGRPRRSHLQDPRRRVLLAPGVERVGRAGRGRARRGRCTRNTCSACRRSVPSRSSSAAAAADPPQIDVHVRSAPPTSAPASPTGRRRRAPATGDRQPHDHRRALADLALDVERAAVPLDDAVDHRQAEAGALLLRREERVEDLRQVVRRDARRRCPRTRTSTTVRRPGRAVDRQRAARGHRLAGVEGDVDERPAAAGRSRPSRAAAAAGPSASATFCICSRWASSDSASSTTALTSTSFSARRALAGEVEQVADDRAAPLGLALHQAQVRACSSRASSRSSSPSSCIRMSSFA